MSRLKKVAEVKTLEEKLMSMSDADFGKYGKVIVEYAEDWIDDKAHEWVDESSSTICEYLIDAVEKNPVDLFEKVQDMIDFIPENIINNLSTEDMKEVCVALVDRASVEVERAIEDVMDGIEIDDNPNNYPYGPGMSQSDYI